MSLFKKAMTTSVASGAPNTAAELFGENIPGGGVPDDNGLFLRARVTAFGAPADFEVRLGSVLLMAFSLTSGQSKAFDLTVLRETTLAGNWRVGGESVDYGSTGFSWTGTQRLAIIGTSPDEGGAICQNACADW